jgi:hypothetical protein
MLNFDRCDSSTLDVTAHVVHTLQRIAELDPATVMVVARRAATYSAEV